MRSSGDGLLDIREDPVDTAVGLTDTHAHLCDEVFDPDREEVLDRAASQGVVGIICVGESLPDAVKNLELAARHPLVRPAAGLFPTRLDPNEAEAVGSFIRKHRQNLYAIGEVGLDYWKVKDEEGRGLQREIFRFFTGLSLEVDLPLNVHSRSSGRYVIELLLESGAKRVQLHAFDGKASTALAGVEAGFFFSIPPSIVRSPQKQKLVKRLPLSCLLVESDSPVLGPSPQSRNEPANVKICLEAIARLKGLDPGEVLEATKANTSALYGSF
jgi:TatD DNase family protein